MMEYRAFFILLAVIILATLCFSCKQKNTELLWNKSIYLVGSPSSPRAVDLNQDGIKDIIIGAGKGELDSLENGVIALDGETGEILWQQKASAQIFGSATILDITQDGVSDVIINGRKHSLMALDGKSGEPIWSYEYQEASDAILSLAKFNFYNASIIPDHDSDGIDDLITINGGNWDALPNSKEARLPAVLLAISGKNGRVIKADTMPDGKESYMSPVLYKSDYEEHIIYGTGGETIGGNLYAIALADFFSNGLKDSDVLLSEEKHGFIATPIMADLNRDETLDIITISHAARISALDGMSNDLLWSKYQPGYESSSALSIGQFNKNDSPDIFAIISKGVWPEYTMSISMALDGADGSVIYQDSSSCFELSSAVSYDLDVNGIDEVILSQNIFDCESIIGGNDGRPLIIDNQLVAIDLTSHNRHIIDDAKGFKNIYSTPWIGDLDGDQFIDFIYCQYASSGIDISRFTGMRIKRISTDIALKKPVLWGEFLGKDGKGLYPLNE